MKVYNFEYGDLKIFKFLKSLHLDLQDSVILLNDAFVRDQPAKMKQFFEDREILITLDINYPEIQIIVKDLCE